MGRSKIPSQFPAHLMESKVHYSRESTTWIICDSMFQKAVNLYAQVDLVFQMNGCLKTQKKNGSWMMISNIKRPHSQDKKKAGLMSMKNKEKPSLEIGSKPRHPRRQIGRAHV